MPYFVRPKLNKYQIIRQSDGEVVGTSETRDKAKKSIKARMAYHNNKPLQDAYGN